jgi:very-short-patch-repair endonuclease
MSTGATEAGSAAAPSGQFEAMNELPMTPMTLSDLAAHGVSSRQASGLVRLGVLHRVLHGVYLHKAVRLTIEIRAACIAKVLPDDAVVCDHTAAWLLGVDCQPAAALDAPLDLDVVCIDGRDRTTRSGIHGGKRDLQEKEIWEVGGVRITSPVRTACDLACRRGRRQALAVLDAFMHSCGVTQADYRGMLPRFRGRRGCTQLRELIEYADGRAESIRESWVRMEIIDAGLIVPELQIWVRVPGLGRRRIDLGYRGRLVAVEHDGEEHHTEDEDVESDEERRDALRRLGWYIIVVRKEDFDGPNLDRWLRELRDVLTERSPSRPRRYARAERRRTRR